MGWIQKLFGKTSDAPIVVLQTGEHRPDQAVCVKLDGAYIIDLSPLPPEPERVLRAIEQVTATIEQSPQAIQVWVAPSRLLEAYTDDTDALMKLIDALFAATKRVEPKMMVETDAPAGVVFVLRSLGFEVFLPGLRLTAIDSNGRASEIDVAKTLAKLRSATPLHV
jgi:hypothetical protein